MEMTQTRGEGRLKIGGTLRPRILETDASEDVASKGATWLADLAKAAQEAGSERLVRLVRSDEDEEARALGAIMALSPYLRGSMLARPALLETLFDTDVSAFVDERIEALSALPSPEMGESDLMKRLREDKRDIALCLALRDLFGAGTVSKTASDLSRLAEGAIGAALRLGLREAGKSGKLMLRDPNRPEEGSGLFVLAMGKLGARELNYSSDVDLIVFFDPDAGICADPMEATDTFSRIVRRLVRILAERTAQGYVFRTDLRLRPDPGAMPLAISTDMAMTYYEGSGRNWERAAMIKAAPIAGDIAAGEAFLDELSPFVWRKYLDFAAIADIQDMKSRIDDHRGFGDIAIPGHNVKLGRGGIREVEFFTQTQQLIAGGRNPALRGRRTEDALEALTAGGWIEAQTARALTDAYWFLRRVEHGVQMVADEQTHDLPADEEGLGELAGLLGFESLPGFEMALTETFALVDRHFTGLFKDGRKGRRARGGAGDKDNAAVTRLLANEEDKDGLDAITALGFARPEDVARILRSWAYGRYRATRTEKARERLTEVLPALLNALSQAPDPDGAVAAFDTFLAGLPSGIQFFSLIASNPRILELLALIITAAPALSATMAQRPHVFDALLDPAFFDEVPDRNLMASRLDAFLEDATDYEDVLARLRIFASEQRFLVGARMLSGVVDLAEAGPAFSNIADVVLDALLEAVVGEFARRHGRVKDMRLSLLGMGRLGSRELTANSDVDLILLYDHDDEADESDGEKPLPVQVYFTRLTQRLIAALTAPMREGALYEVDFRLRPSGNAGPLATRLATFRRYQEAEAWTWERMALTRARVVAGDPDLGKLVEETVETLLALPRERNAVTEDVRAMRGRIEREKPPRGALDLKLRPGGLIDLEFIAQWAQLTGRVEGITPGTPTADVLAAFDRTLEGEEGPLSLANSMARLAGVMQLGRLTTMGSNQLGDLPPRLADRLANALGCKDAEAIGPVLDETTEAVRERFKALIGDPMA
ncbi:MAG: bifunctional [glutamine synthetase] adenylyltransferase/[glutamine synthetase]-adenylyl-L-tyrosine phosphorylase [Fulvimarina manganoxydans]|nr:bifunctional [glutamine synthetase] adenylyltransferase/[glutamine synthetase]-adenylyl-L-tyrosine phosphorylase [Fulvimarina manganoxydans]